MSATDTTFEEPELTPAARQTVENMTYFRVTSPEVFSAMADLRSGYRLLVGLVDHHVPDERPREKQMAFRSLEDSLQYAIAGLARHHGEPVEG